MQGIERVEELFLDSLTARQELDVVNQQDVVGAIPVLELLDALLAQGLNEVVCEGLTGDVAGGHIGRRRGDVVRDCLQQVRLAKAGGTVDEERVVGLAWRLGNGERCGMSKAIRRADHEGIERRITVEGRHTLGASGSGNCHNGRRHGRCRCRSLARGRGRGNRCVLNANHDRHFQRRAVDGRCCRRDEIHKVARDPAPHELVRHFDLERLSRQTAGARSTEPRAVRRRCEGLLQLKRDGRPERRGRCVGSGGSHCGSRDRSRKAEVDES